MFDLGGGIKAKEKTYTRPVYKWRGRRNCSQPKSLNIGTDLEINRHFPEYDLIRRSRGVGEGLF